MAPSLPLSTSYQAGILVRKEMRTSLDKKAVLWVVIAIVLVCLSGHVVKVSATAFTVGTVVGGNWYSVCGNPACSPGVPAPSLNAVNCPTGHLNPNNDPNLGGSQPSSFYCGYKLTPGLLKSVDWHNYPTTPGQTAQAYLNALTLTSGTSLKFVLANPPTGSIHTGTDLHWYDSTEASPTEPWRHPVNDYGYYLSTYNKTNTPGITICAGSVTNCPSASNPNWSGSTGISFLSFYWGSIDPWDQIGFCSASGACTYVYGDDLPGFSINDRTPHGNGPLPNIFGAVAAFNPTCSPVGCTPKPWAYVTFTSCDRNGNCNPAFEIDNLLFSTSSTNCCGPITGGGSLPGAPEPSGILLFGTAAAGATGVLRHRARSRRR